MNNLSAFLKENVEPIPNKKLVVSNRFKDAKGNPIEWEIRAITCEENEALQRDAYVQRKLPNGQTIREMDQIKYTSLLLAESVVTPDLNSVELQDSYKVKTPSALLKQMLYPREEAYLAKAVVEFSQIENLGELVDEAKN